LARNAASVTPRTAVAAGFTVGARIDSSLERGCVQLFIPLPAWSTTSSLWPTRIEAACVVSVAVTSKLMGLEAALGVGGVCEAVPTLPHPAITIVVATTRIRILISQT
jgi:hypothetical protein